MIHQKNPFRVPTGDDKIIEEHFGKASQGGDQLSPVSYTHLTLPTILLV